MHSKLVEAQSGVWHFISENERVEATLNDSQNPADRKGLEVMLTRLQGELQSQKGAEQEWLTKEAQATQEFRAEETKLAVLQEQLDQLDKILEQSGRAPTATAVR